MPRCTNCYHRSPDGDCEEVNDYDIDKNDYNDYIDSSTTKNEKNNDEYINTPH